MKLLSAILAIAVIFTCTANARIGETLGQCTARYGPKYETRTEDGETSYIFTKAGLRVAILFAASGRADSITFTMAPVEGQIYTGPMTAANADLLLAANGGGRKWIKRPHAESEATVRWHTEDDALDASFDVTRIVIEAQGASVRRATARSDARRAAERAAAAKALKGF